MFSNKLFKKYCSAEWLPIFDLNKSTIHVKAKERIFNEGDLVKGIYFIEEGKKYYLDLMERMKKLFVLQVTI
jgi:hypothetical protein